MKYVLLIYGDESAVAQATAEQLQEHVREAVGWIKQAGQALQGGEPLAPTAAATTVRVRKGKKLTTDGPFAETKEQLAGFFVVDCRDLDEAIELAARLPFAHSGSVEVRPVHEELARLVFGGL